MSDTQGRLFKEPPEPRVSRGAPLPPCGKGVILYVDEDEPRLVAAPTLCGAWQCPRCGPMRMRRARALALAGKPERIITLTTRPKPGWSLEASVRWFRKRWSLLLARIRRHFGKFEYMQVTELHRSGWPHMHILTRGCYIPQRMLARWWIELTGSFKVHIQKVAKTWKGIAEATKYCLKTARAFHKACPSLPVYTKSLQWAPKGPDDEKKPPGNYTFYAYVPYGWKLFSELLVALNCYAEPIPDSPGRLEVHSRGPPPQRFVDFVYSDGAYPDMVATAALNHYFGAKTDDPLTVPQMQDRLDFDVDLRRDPLQPRIVDAATPTATHPSSPDAGILGSAPWNFAAPVPAAR